MKVQVARILKGVDSKYDKGEGGRGGGGGGGGGESREVIGTGKGETGRGDGSRNGKRRKMRSK